MEESFEGFVLDVIIEKREFLDLQNNFKDIGLFCEEVENCRTKILTKGISNTTHYIKIPLGIKTKKKEEWQRFFAQKIEDEKAIYYLFRYEKD